jgi:hypothetical protein
LLEYKPPDGPSGLGINALGKLIKYSDPENAFITISESEQPYSDVTTSLTLYLLYLEYLCSGSKRSEKVPSPKLHLYFNPFAE